MHEGEEELPVWYVTLFLMLFVAWLAWAFAAAGYATEQEGLSPFGRRLFRLFVWNAVAKLPDLPAVLSYTFKEKLWMPITLAVVEVLVVLLGVVLKVVEKQMVSTKKRRRRR